LLATGKCRYQVAYFLTGEGVRDVDPLSEEPCVDLLLRRIGAFVVHIAGRNALTGNVQRKLR
jgi:hypothetical protein